MTKLVEFVHRDPGADVLVVTNMWPEEERPVYGIFVRRQVDDLRAAGLLVDVVYLRGYRSPLAYLWGALWFAWSSVRLRRRYRLVHVHAGEAALAARCHLGTAMIVTYHGDDMLGNPRSDGSIPLRSRLRAAVVRTHARSFAASITQSAAMTSRLPGRARRRSNVLPMGVDAGEFRPFDRDEARQQLGWDRDQRVALFAATKPHAPRKRLHLAREACRRAEQQVGPIRLFVTADVEPGTMPLLMSAADVLLHTASLEGGPIAVKEALMCNLPVVATPAGFIEELLRGVEPSFVCPAEPDALAEALVACLARPRRSNGRTAAAHFTSEATTERLLALYGSLADIRVTPSPRVPAWTDA